MATTTPTTAPSPASVPSTLGPLASAAADKRAADKIKEDERKRRMEEAQKADRPATVPLVPGETQGEQTRGGNRLGATPAGKELIGMRSGVPIYADATDVYGAPKETAAGAPQTREEQRAEYQAKQAPMAAAAMAPGKPAQTYWSPEYAKSYTQKAAQQAALARIGGQDAYNRRATEAEKFAAERTRNLAGFEAQKNREAEFAARQAAAPAGMSANPYYGQTNKTYGANDETVTTKYFPNAVAGQVFGKPSTGVQVRKSAKVNPFRKF